MDVHTFLTTRKSSCVNARGIPTAAYQVLHPGWTWLRYPPPPRCGQTDGWMDGQTRVKTLPPRRTTYAVGNKHKIPSFKFEGVGDIHKKNYE